MDRKDNNSTNADRMSYLELEAQIIEDIVIVDELDEHDESSKGAKSLEERFTEAIKKLDESLQNIGDFDLYCDKVLKVSAALSGVLNKKIELKRR